MAAGGESVFMVISCDAKDDLAASAIRLPQG
jgi:hypothetical protein